MEQSNDPFEAGFVEQEESPPESPIEDDDIENPVGGGATSVSDVIQPRDEGREVTNHPNIDLTSAAAAARDPVSSSKITHPNNKTKDEDDEEEEENMDVQVRKVPSSGDPDKTAIMQTILSQFTEEQMSRYESFRRSGFQKSVMKRLLFSITGSQKVSMPMTIVVSGIAKMFVGDLVETAKIVMTERKDSGPIRPSHMREAYRRLKIEGKVPKRSVPRLFR